jgi:hypothetical protein
MVTGLRNVMPVGYEWATECTGIPYQGIYEGSITQKYAIGCRYDPCDGTGRVFRYCKAGATILRASYAVGNTKSQYEGNTASTNATAIGERKVTIPATASGNSEVYSTKNCLQGGLLIQMNTAREIRSYAIQSNTASDGTNIIVTLFDGVTYAIGASEWITVIPNPWSYAASGQTAESTPQENVQNLFVVGVTMLAWTINYYYWVQTWGPIFMVNSPGMGTNGGEKMLIFKSDGSLDSASGLANADASSYQIAGYIISDTVGQAGGAGDDSHIFLMIAP